MAKPGSSERLDRAVARAQVERDRRERGYRARALEMYPWVCGRCTREFHRDNLHQLTVHHRDHDHDNNPPDGSNWELLCLYCHDNEHARYVEPGHGESRHERKSAPATHQPFADLASRLNRKRG